MLMSPTLGEPKSVKIRWKPTVSPTLTVSRSSRAVKDGSASAVPNQPRHSQTHPIHLAQPRGAQASPARAKSCVRIVIVIALDSCGTKPWGKRLACQFGIVLATLRLPGVSEPPFYPLDWTTIPAIR